VGSLLIFFFLDAAKFSPSVLERGMLERGVPDRGVLDWETHLKQPDLMAAFQHSYHKEKFRDKARGIIKISPLLQDALERWHAHTASLTPLLLPMVVKPLAWTAFDVGCYLIAKTQVMRVVDFGEQERLCKAADMSRIYKVCPPPPPHMTCMHPPPHMTCRASTRRSTCSRAQHGQSTPRCSTPSSARG
jgi:hypothetical protein